jgi:hypothetical protein
MYVQSNIEVRSCNYCCSRKAVSITYSECVFVALIIQNTKGMHRGILSSVASPALRDYSTLSHKRQELRKTVIERTMCVVIFCTNIVSETSHSTKN